MKYPVVLLEDYGEEPVTLPKATWAWGDKKTLKVVFVSMKRTDLTGATATCAVTDSGGNSVATPSVTPVISTTPGKYRATCEATIDASTTPFTSAGGSYVAKIQFVIGSLKRTVRIPLTVVAVP